MNPQNNEATRSSAPFEGEPSDSSAEIEGPSPEKLPVAPERAAQVAPPPASLPTLPFAPTPTGQDSTSDDSDDQQRPASSISTKDNPAEARDDKDVIEKEWIARTKQIISGTRADPYKQSEELTVLKADYMKKRYNKTIKIDK